MEIQPTHLLSDLGILASFSISKKVSRDELKKITTKVKKVFKKNDDPIIFQKMIIDALVENAKLSANLDIPPGLVLNEDNLKKLNLNEYYTQLFILSQSLSKKLFDKKLTKQQICFIINFFVNAFEITEMDFDQFNQNFQKFKNDDFDSEE